MVGVSRCWAELRKEVVLVYGDSGAAESSIGREKCRCFRSVRPPTLKYTCDSRRRVSFGDFDESAGDQLAMPRRPRSGYVIVS